jgi:uncharacterized RDD family membrane protein YckC
MCSLIFLVKKMLLKMWRMEMFKFEVNKGFRALARFCDYSLCFLALGAITLFLPYFYCPLFYYYLAAATPVLWAPLDALLISRWGRTPGLALFGLSVADAKGSHLSYVSALRRALFLPGRSSAIRQKSLSWKRKFGALLAASAFVSAAIYGNILALWSVGLEKGFSQSGWVQYASREAGFHIAFPSDPETASRELVIPDSGKVLSYMEITSNEGRKVHYSVSHLELPRKWRLAGNTTLLKGVLDLLVKHAEGSQLLEKEFKMHAGHRVLDYRMKAGDEEVRGRLIIVGGTLYKLTITYPAALAKEIQENPFLDSFEIA